MNTIITALAVAVTFAQAAGGKPKDRDYATSQERRCFCIQFTGKWPSPYFLGRLDPAPKDCEGVKLSSATRNGPDPVHSGLWPCEDLQACVKKMSAVAERRQFFLNRMKIADERLAKCCPLGVCDESCAAPARQEKSELKLDLAGFEGGIKQDADCFGGVRPVKGKGGPAAQPASSSSSTWARSSN